MEVMLDRCAALDVHKKTVTASVRTPALSGGRAETTRTFRTFLDELVELREWLLAQGVTEVAMEATSSYWLGVWRVLEEPAGDGQPPFRLLLCNARHVKHVPGRKTDVGDAQWLSQLLEAGLLRASFVPPPHIRALRRLTRYRKILTEARTAEIQRLEKTLEDAVIKLGAVASSTLTKSGRNMMEALIEGERDPEVLADMALARMRAKIPQLVRALDGRFEHDHAAHLRRLLNHIDWLNEAITTLNGDIAQHAAPYRDLIERLCTIPGVGQRVAEVIVAELGNDMTLFPDHGHLASWTGLCPGHNESGGKRRSGRTRHANRWLRDMLIEAAWAAQRNPDTYLAAKFRSIAGPRPDPKRKNKAAVAVAHKIIIAVYYIISTPGETYHDLGADWLTRNTNPERRKQRLISQLQDLGYDVNLTPVA